MRVVRFSLKLLAIPILLVLLAIQWGLTFVVSLSGGSSICSPASSSPRPSSPV